MPTRKGVIGLEVQGLGRVVSAGKQVATSFAKVNLVLGGVDQVIGKLQAAWESMLNVLQGAAADEGIAQSFERLTGGAAQAEQAMATLKSTTSGLLDETSLQTAANKLLSQQLDISTQRMGDMFNAAIALGRASGKTAKDSVDQLTNALKSGEVEGFKNLGLTVDLGAAHKALAKDLGVSTDALTLQQKQAATLDAVTAELGKKAGALGDVQTPLANANDRLSATFEDMWSRINAVIANNPSFIRSMENVADIIVNVADAAAKAFAHLQPFIELASKAFAVASSVGSAVNEFVGSALPFGFAGSDLAGALAGGLDDFSNSAGFGGQVQLRGETRLADSIDRLVGSRVNAVAGPQLRNVASELDRRSSNYRAQGWE